MSIHPTAIIDPRATVHPSADIRPYVVIDGPVHVGADCEIGPHAVLMGDTHLGAGCRVHAHVAVGDIPQDKAFDGEQSSVRIGNQCILREGVTIHRGTGEGSQTVLGHRCMLMSNAHVGHNCVLGDEVVLVSGALLGGHVEVGDRAIISGNSAIHQFVRIGELAMIHGVVPIKRDIPPFLMADENGKVAGVNIVGLARGGFSAEERKEVKDIYKHLYRMGLKHAEALELLNESVCTEPGRRLLQFVTESSARGLSRGGQDRRKAA